MAGQVSGVTTIQDYFDFCVEELGIQPVQVLEMSLREIELSRRAFLFQQAHEWNRARWMVTNLGALVGSKLTPQQILPIPILDHQTEGIPTVEITDQDKEWVKRIAETWHGDGRNKG